VVTGLPVLPRLPRDAVAVVATEWRSRRGISRCPAIHPQKPKAKSDPHGVKTAVGRRMIPNAPTISETQAMPNPKNIML
jgi:hypothetical protein